MVLPSPFAPATSKSQMPCGYPLVLLFLHQPGISKSLDPVTGQLSNTVAAKLTAVEGTLKENVTKLVKSKVRVGFGCKEQMSLSWQL